jgi:signal transduction histidine kinase
MTEDQTATAPGWLRQLVAFVRSAEPRASLSRRAVALDISVAAGFLAASLVSGSANARLGLVPAILISVALAARRRYPLTMFFVVLLAALFDKAGAVDVTFLAVIFAGYSAAVHSRFRGAALLLLAPAGMLVAVAYWRIPTATMMVVPGQVGPAPTGLQGLQTVAGPSAARVGGVLVLVSLVSIAIVGAAMYAGDRIRRMQAEHEAATRRAIEAERARIAAELHDVVTHNVSVMIVQAGAARQVLADSPAQATNALLAVEAGGRAAMAELRHLLGLLSPAGSAAPAANGSLAEQDLRPQPGLRQTRQLIERVAAAGLPVELLVSERRYELPAGLDLAAFRVVQEALTNVLKHAGEAPTKVRIDYGESAVVVDVADAGLAAPVPGLATPVPGLAAPVPGLAAPVPWPAIPAGAGRGLIGLRERVSLYGGELDAGPRPGGGWRVRARFPVDPGMLVAEPVAAETAERPERVTGLAPMAARLR